MSVEGPTDIDRTELLADLRERADEIAEASVAALTVDDIKVLYGPSESYRETLKRLANRGRVQSSASSLPEALAKALTGPFLPRSKAIVDALLSEAIAELRADGLHEGGTASPERTQLLLDRFGLSGVRAAAASLLRHGQDTGPFMVQLASYERFVLKDASFEPFRRLARPKDTDQSSLVLSPLNVPLLSIEESSLEELGALVQNALSLASEALGRVFEAVSTGRSPRKEDLLAIGGLWTVTEQLRQAGKAKGIDVETDDPMDLVVRLSSASIDPVKERLTRISRLTGPESLAAQIEETRARALSALGGSDSSDRSLEVLARLIDAVAAQSQVEIHDLSEEALNAVPSHLNRLVIAAVRNELCLPAAGDISEAGSDFGQPVQPGEPDEDEQNASELLDGSRSSPSDDMSGETRAATSPGEPVPGAETEGEVTDQYMDHPPTTLGPEGMPVSGEVDGDKREGADKSPLPVDKGVDTVGKAQASDYDLTEPDQGLTLVADAARKVPTAGVLAQMELEAVQAGRFSLASEVCRTAGLADRADAYAAAALMSGVRSTASSLATASLRRLSSLAESVAEDRVVELLSLSSSLRLGVFETSLEATESLSAPRPTLAGCPKTLEFVELMTRVGRSGLNIAANSAATSSMTAVNESLLKARRKAEDALEKGPRRETRYNAATRVWRRWIAPNGVLGELLSAAKDDDRTRLEDVAREVARLRDRDEIIEEIANADDRANRRNEIIARARNTLIEWALATLETVSDWVQAAEAVDAAAPDDKRGVLLGDLRTLAERHGDEISAEIRGIDGSDLIKAVSNACANEVRATLDLIRAGIGPVESEPSESQILTRDLLLAPGPNFDQQGVPLGELSAEQLRVALNRSPSSLSDWHAAYDDRSGLGDHVATERIVAEVIRLDHSLGSALADRRERDLESKLLQVGRHTRSLLDDLASARSHGHLDDDEWSTLSGRFEAISLEGRLDLGVVTGELEVVREHLERARADSVRASEQRLEELVAAGAPQLDVDRVRQALDRNDVAAADEYIALLRDGRPLPSVEPPRADFGVWWPSAAGQLSELRLDSRTIVKIRRKEEVHGISFDSIGEVECDEAITALQAWIELSDAPTSGAHRDVQLSHVAPVLQLLGVEAQGLSAVPQPRAQNDRVWHLLGGFQPTGRAMVPDFGSQASGAQGDRSLLLLLVWGTPKSSSIESWISAEGSKRPVMIWHFGVLDPTDRVILADRLREQRHRRSVIIVDDSLLCYLAAQPNRDYETTMRLVLPFSASNPFMAVGGLTPPEMFYGRDQERQELQDMMGSALVYGGRQLGKSSLLRATERDFDNGLDRRALYLDVRKEQIGGVRPPSEIWLLLWRALHQIGILPEAIPAKDPSDKLQAAVLKWLDAGDGRALLVLMDECDAFLASDAENNFDTIDKLEGFMADSGRRIKFVFAGLHRVQRFASVENHPLAHLGRPIAVGPLRSEAAMKLVTRPMEALGYRFEHPELPSRILAFCNNNPSLIVLFMNALVARMLETKLQRPGQRRPPVIVTDADVEQTYSKESLAEQIKERFDLTIELDPAYKVIAYTVAHETREAGDRGTDIEIAPRRLRELATGWWPRGFQDMSHDGFRGLCDELVDLGVLARVSDGYALRSPNILRFLGSADQISEVLIEAEHREPAVSFDAASARPRLAGDEFSRSPLTASQLSDLVAPRDQIRLVIGTRASGLDRVLTAVRESAENTSVSVDTPAPSTTQLRSFKNTSGRHRILVLDLRSVDSHRARTLLLEAANRPRTNLGSLGIVFIADGEHAELIRTATTDPDLQRVGFVELRRVDKAAWRHWVSDAELPPSNADAEELLRASGGWLTLLEPATRDLRASATSKARKGVVEKFTTAVDEPETARRLLDEVGLVDGGLKAAWKAICDECPEGATRTDLEAAVELYADEPNPRDTVELLRMLGVLEARGDILAPEPALARAQAQMS